MLKARTGTQDLNFSGEHLFKVQNWASYHCLCFSWLFNSSFGFFLFRSLCCRWGWSCTLASWLWLKKVSFWEGHFRFEQYPSEENPLFSLTGLLGLTGIEQGNEIGKQKILKLSKTN